MTYTLYIGNKRYSSWSMRPWLVLKTLRIPFEEKIQLFKPGLRQPDFLSFSPSGKVPCLHDTTDERSVVIWDSLAIVEYLAERHPEVWPADPVARSFARSAAAEMHSGFGALREECSMNVALVIDMGPPSEALQRDLDRLSELFEEGLERFGGPWLAGREFSAADAFFSPIACRRDTYGLRFEGAAGKYVECLSGNSATQQWVLDGIKETARESFHEEEATKGRAVLEDHSEL